jgi:hypothetical protein
MYRRPVLAALALLLIGSFATAADFVVPQQKIVGAETPVALGELVTLSVTQPDKVPNLASTSYAWKIFDGTVEKKFAVDANGNVFFGAGLKPKQLLAVVSITHVFLVKDGDKVKQVATKTVLQTTKVTIGDGQPEPGPQPQPDPTFPAGKYQLGQFSWETARDKVNPTGRAAVAKAMATSFRNVVKSIQAGDLKDAGSILKATKQSNDAALGNSSAAWDQFGEALQERLLSLFQAGSLKNTDDFVTAWTEISLGLDAVK